MVCQPCLVSDDMAWEHIKRVVTKGSQPDSWDSVMGAILGGVPHRDKDEIDLPDFLRKSDGPSLHVVPPKDLPRASGSLERLLREANDLVAYYSEYKLSAPFSQDYEASAE